MHLSTAQLKQISASLFQFFRSKDRPPANEMKIPISSIRAERGSVNTFFATIIYIVEYCGKKEHTVRIKFKVDTTGKFLNETWSYV